MEKSQEVWVMLDHQKKNRTTSITEDIFKQRTASKQAVFPTCLPQAPVRQEIHTPDSLKKSPNNRFCLNYWKNGVHRAINLNYLAFITIKPQNSTWLFSRADVITFCYAKILFQKWAKWTILTTNCWRDPHDCVRDATMHTQIRGRVETLFLQKPHLETPGILPAKTRSPVTQCVWNVLFKA